MNRVQAAFDLWRAAGADMDKGTADAIDAVLVEDTDRPRDDADSARSRPKNPADPAAVRTLWADMAAGQFSPQHLAFIQTVAQAAMHIDEHTREAPAGATKSQARAARIARERALGRVLGLNGPADKYAAIRRPLEAAWVLHALGSGASGRRRGDFRDLKPEEQDEVIARHRHLLPDPARFDGSDGRREVRRAIAESLARGKGGEK